VHISDCMQKRLPDIHREGGKLRGMAKLMAELLAESLLRRDALPQLRPWGALSGSIITEVEVPDRLRSHSMELLSALAGLVSPDTAPV